MEKICWQITIATSMQPLQYDLRCPDAAARSNLDAAITVRSAGAELQSTIELRATTPEIVAPKPDLGAKAKKKTIVKHFLKGNLRAKSPAPKLRKPVHKSLWQSGCSHFTTIYDVQLQKTIYSITHAAATPSRKTKLSCQTSSKTRSWRCENEGFVIPLKKWKIWKRSFRVRIPWKKPSLTCENQSWTGNSTARPIGAWSAPSRTCSATFARQTPIHLPRHVLCCKTAFRASAVSQTKLSCETSLRNWKLKMRKQSFRDFAQKGKVEDMKTKLSCEIPSKIPTLTCYNQAWTGNSTARPIRAWSAPSWACSATFARQTFPTHLPRHVLSIKTQHSVHPLSLKNAFYARLPSITASWKMWKRSFCARPPSDLKVENVKATVSWESSVQNWNNAFVQGCEISFAVRSLAMRFDFFAVRLLCSETSLLWELFAVRSPLLWDLLLCDFFAVRLLCCEFSLLWDFFAVRLLCCEISLQWDFFAVRSFCCEISLLWDIFAMRSLCCETSLLWDSFAVRPLCCQTSLLWDPFVLRPLCYAISSLWDFCAVRSLCCETSLLRDFNGFQRSVKRKLDFQTSFHKYEQQVILKWEPICKDSRPHSFFHAEMASWSIFIEASNVASHEAWYWKWQNYTKLTKVKEMWLFDGGLYLAELLALLRGFTITFLDETGTATCLCCRVFPGLLRLPYVTGSYRQLQVAHGRSSLLYCYVFVMFGLFWMIQMCQALHQGNWAKIRKETIGLQVRSHLSRVLSRALNTVSFQLIQLLYILVV